MSRVVLNDPPPRTLRECYTPRSLTQAFGPYAHLDGVKRRDPDRVVGLWMVALVGALAALVVSGVIR